MDVLVWRLTGKPLSPGKGENSGNGQAALMLKRMLFTAALLASGAAACDSATAPATSLVLSRAPDFVAVVIQTTYESFFAPSGFSLGVLGRAVQGLGCYSAVHDRECWGGCRRVEACIRQQRRRPSPCHCGFHQCRRFDSSLAHRLGWLRGGRGA